MNEGERDNQSAPMPSNYFLNPMQQLGSTVLLLTSPDDNLYRLELSFRSVREDSSGKISPIPDGFGGFVKPLMNERGIAHIIGLIQSVLSRVTILSNLDQKEILAIQDYLADTLARDLMLNRVYYCIEDASVRDTVYCQTLIYTFICMKRAFLEGDRRFLKGSQQEITTRVQQENSGGGLMSKLTGWGRK
jgi:hypothetical protein